MYNPRKLLLDILHASTWGGHSCNGRLIIAVRCMHWKNTAGTRFNEHTCA